MPRPRITIYRDHLPEIRHVVLLQCRASGRRAHAVTGRLHATGGCGDRELHKVGAADTEPVERSEEHTSELQSLMRISYAVFCLKKKKNNQALNYMIIIRR